MSSLQRVCNEENKKLEQARTYVHQTERELSRVRNLGLVRHLSMRGLTAYQKGLIPVEVVEGYQGYNFHLTPDEIAQKKEETNKGGFSRLVRKTNNINKETYA